MADSPHLGVRGGDFWAAANAGFVFTPTEAELLLESCRLMDELEELAGAVARDGVTVLGAAGQVRSNPALGEARQHRQTLGRLLAQLALPDAEGGTLPSPTKIRAQRAAQARWRDHIKGGGLSAGA